MSSFGSFVFIHSDLRCEIEPDALSKNVPLILVLVVIFTVVGLRKFPSKEIITYA